MTILNNTSPPARLPGLYVNIQPPPITFLSPAETDILGIVGTAVWGPVDAPTPVGGLAEYAATFGNPQARLYDMGTALWAANLQGAQNFVGVRVTDGTDTAATGAVGIVGTPTSVDAGADFAANDTVTFSNGAILTVETVTAGAIATFSVLQQPTAQTTGTLDQTATSGSGTGATFSFTYAVGASVAGKYTGSLGNSVTVNVAPGSKTGSWRVITNLPGVGSETFDNIGASLSGTALWAAIVAAVNNGNALRGGSNLVVLTAGTSSAAPYAQTISLATGTDGTATITDTVLLGEDTSPRSGMYALRKQNCAVGLLADCSTPASWPTQAAFALSEGVYMVGVSESGDTISDAVTNLTDGGVDCYGFKLLFGDWCYFNDTINGAIRVISPQGFVAGLKAAQGPQFSTLNQPLQGIVGTQKTATNTVYQDDDLETLQNAGIDVVTNPSVGGPYFSCRLGCNTSSDPATNGDNYPTMTNFIAQTLNQGLGPFVGKLQSPTVQQEALATLNAFFYDMWQKGVIGTSTPSQVPFAVSIANGANVPQGQMIASAQVTYLSVIDQFITNVQGGQTVTVTTGNPQAAS